MGDLGWVVVVGGGRVCGTVYPALAPSPDTSANRHDSCVLCRELEMTIHNLHRDSVLLDILLGSVCPVFSCRLVQIYLK